MLHSFLSSCKLLKKTARSLCFSPSFSIHRYIVGTVLVLTVIFLPELLIPIAQTFFKEKIMAGVVASLKDIVNDESYCIIAPRIVETGGDSYREWTVVNDPLDIQMDHVIDHAIREKLIFYAKEGRSIKQRSEFGREMHFGVSLRDNFFIWSFKENKFVSLNIPGTPRYLDELKRKYSALTMHEKKESYPLRYKSIDYYCPHLYE